MTFKDIKTGYPIYILDKDNATLTTAKVVSVGLPHIDSKMGGNLAVDIMVENNGNNATYTLSEKDEIGYTPNGCISTNKECIRREVEAMKTQSENIIKSVDRHKEIVGKCEELLKDLDPIFKEKAATEERFNKIESMLEKLLNNR